MAWYNSLNDLKGDIGAGAKAVGHVVAKPMGVAQRVAGTVGGAMIGGPAGAMAGYRLGDKLGNIYEDALGGHDVRSNLGSNLMGAAQGAAGVYGSSKLPNNGGLANIGRSGPASAAGGSGGGGSGIVPQIGAAIGGALGGGSSSGGSGIPGLQSIADLLGQGKDFLTGNGGMNALATAQGVNAAMLGKKSSDFANNAMGSVQQNWDERAPLRTAGAAGMLHPEAGIAPQIAALPNRNLYAQKPTIGPAVPSHG